MYRPILFIIFIVLLACQGKKPSVEQSGTSLLRSDTTLKLIQSASGQVSPYEEIEIGGSEFQLVRRDGDTLFLSTRDSHFKTPEGYGVGTSFRVLPENLRKQVSKEPGFSYAVNLKSGWVLGFCEGSSCTDKEPVDTSKVDMVYKRK